MNWREKEAPMLQQLTKRIWFLPHEERRDRPTLTYVRGNRLSLAVDAGASPAHVQAFYEAITRQGMPLPQLTALTHWHWDHSFGLCAVTGHTLCSRQTAQKLREVAQWTWTREAMARRLSTGEDILFCHEHILEEYPDPQSIQVRVPEAWIEGEGEIDLGGLCARFLCCDSPHSRDALLVSVGEALILGDAGYEDFYELNRAYDPVRLKEWLRLMKNRQEPWIIQGHQPPVNRAQAWESWENIARSME